MNPEAVRQYLLQRPEAAEDYPFGPNVAVIKVAGKMFAALSSDDGQQNMNLKCDPDEAQILRDIFPAVRPGYHMNKRHWNTLVLDGSVPQGETERMIDNSYALVVKGLPRAKRQALELAYGPETLYP